MSNDSRKDFAEDQLKYRRRMRRTKSTKRRKRDNGTLIFHDVRKLGQKDLEETNQVIQEAWLEIQAAHVNEPVEILKAFQSVLNAKSPSRAAADSEAKRLANKYGISQRTIMETLFKRGDLRSMIPWLLGEEAFLEHRLKLARVVFKIGDFLERAGWPFDWEDFWIVPPDRKSEAIAAEREGRLQESLIIREYTANFRESSAASESGDPFEKRWEKIHHPLSQEIFRRVASTLNKAEASKKLKEFQKYRRGKQLNKGPDSQSLEAPKLAKILVKDLYDLFVKSLYDQRFRGAQSERSSVSAKDMAETVSKGEKGEAKQDAIELVRVTFPPFGHALCAKRIWGTGPFRDDPAG